MDYDNMDVDEVGPRVTVREVYYDSKTRMKLVSFETDLLFQGCHGPCRFYP